MEYDGEPNKIVPIDITVSMPMIACESLYIHTFCYILKMKQNL